MNARIAWTSNEQVGELLASFGIELSSLTPGGKLSVREEVLELLRDRHPLIPALIEYRHAVKELGMSRTLLAAVDPCSRAIHCEWLATGVPTGRFRSRGPSLQQIPESLRSAFVARAGRYFVAADYDQIELRILAACSGERTLIEAFEMGLDPHAKTASVMLGVPLDRVTPDQRDLGKTLNYALNYGTGASGLARRLRIPGRKAKKLLADYFAAMPALVRFLQHLQDQAEIHGYVQSYFGRRRPLPELYSNHPKVRAYGLRSAVNNFAQMSQADILKHAMLRLAKALPQCKAQMLLTLHDAVLLEVPESYPPEVVVPVLRSAMETSIEGVPLTVSVSSGPSWGQLRKSTL